MKTCWPHFYVYSAVRVGWVQREDGTSTAMTQEQVSWWLYATRNWNAERRRVEATYFGVHVK